MEGIVCPFAKMGFKVVQATHHFLTLKSAKPFS